MTRARHLNSRETVGRRNREGKGSSASKKRLQHYDGQEIQRNP